MLTPHQQLEGIIRTREEEFEAAHGKEWPQDDIPMNHRKVGVIIVGAGIGGLTLGALLEIARVPYVIVERADQIKRLGSAMAFGCNIMGVFRQLKMEKEFLDNAKPTLHLEVFNDDLESIMMFENKNQEAAGGSHMYIIDRPTMYDMLLRRIPAHKLVLGQRVLDIKQGDNGAQVNTAQGYIEGDIIVGADGAYSSIRKRMYESMVKRKQQLDPEDLEKLPYKYVSVLGQTESLSPEEYKELSHEESAFQCVVGKDGYAWTTFTTKSNSICWNVMLTLNKETSKIHNTFLKCEWGTEDADSMVEHVRGFRIPNGDGTKTIGDLISKTPKHLISKVTLEEKVFSTWHFQRIVLIGDARAKIHPTGGVGGMLAMQDAVVLANWINVLPMNPKMERIEEIFSYFQKERKQYIDQGFEHSKANSRLTRATVKGALSRMMVNWLPTRILEKTALAMVGNRPLVSFLPEPEDNGFIPRDRQPSFEWTRFIMKRTNKPIMIIRPGHRKIKNNHTNGEKRLVFRPHPSKT